MNIGPPIIDLLAPLGGGVAVYVRNTINYISRTELDTDDLETITVEISKPRSNRLLLIVCIGLQTQQLNYSVLMKN